ncbi:MAG: hypothetical protein P4L78_00040, partial [Silvimonas sp.]|nr:hypothetical protein [Silvimonas sp.]
MSSLASGGRHICVLMSGGVYCWGWNLYGQLGQGSVTTTGCACLSAVPSTPVLSGVLSLTAGQFHTCVLTSGYAVSCWGDDTYGELGNGVVSSGTTVYAPTSVSASVSVSPTSSGTATGSGTASVTATLTGTASVTATDTLTTSGTASPS